MLLCFSQVVEYDTVVIQVETDARRRVAFYGFPSHFRLVVTVDTANDGGRLRR